MASVWNENGSGRLVAVLGVEAREVDAGPVKPRGGPGLEPSPPKSEPLQRFRELTRRRFTGAAGRPLFRPDVNEAVEERARGDDDAPGR